MNRIEIKGIIPPIITPMHADESINTAELRRQVDRQIENGVHALFCFGTNGEGYILDGREKQLVLETVIEQDERTRAGVRGHRLRFHTGDHCTVPHGQRRGSGCTEYYYAQLCGGQPTGAVRPLPCRG